MNIQITDHTSYFPIREKVVIPTVHLKREDGNVYECEFVRFEATGPTEEAAKNNLMMKVSARLFSLAYSTTGERLDSDEDAHKSDLFVSLSALIAAAKASVLQLGNTIYSFPQGAGHWTASGDFAVLIREPVAAKKFFAEFTPQGDPS